MPFGLSFGVPLRMPFRLRQRGRSLMASPVADLSWVDGFIDRIRPYIFVREIDHVLVRMPNQAFKLNRSGCRILRYLLNGGRISVILSEGRHTAGMADDLSAFFSDLAAMLGGTLGEYHRSPALNCVPFEHGYIERPILSEVALTYECNVRCRFCYAGCECVPAGRGRRDAQKRWPPVAPGQVAKTDFRKILNLIRNQAEVPSVSFTGGEPMLAQDLFELVAYASDTLGMRVNLITNGTLIDDRAARRLKKAGLASAQVSIEADRGFVHDAITGLTGSWEASVNGLVSLRDAGIFVHPHATLCRLNRDGIVRLPAFAKSLGIDRFSLNMVIPAGRALEPGLGLGYAEIPAILSQVMAAARTERVRFMWYSPTPMCLFNPIPLGLGNKGCSACEGLLSVNPAGDLLPCSSWPEPVGNLLTDGFETLWFGNRARWIREKREAHAGCRGCKDFALCHGACPLYFQANGYDEIEPYLPVGESTTAACLIAEK
jgi:radical SAM protein with 4Fe4S-binding SPASM domain